MKHLVLLLTGAMLLGTAACAQPETASTTTPAITEAEVVAPVVEVAPQPVTETESVENTTEQPAVEEVAPAEQAAEAEAVEPSENAPALELVPAEEVDWLMVTSRIEYDLSLLGNPDAPVTMIEYSDFM